MKYTIKAEHFLHWFNATTHKRSFEHCLLFNNNNYYNLKLESFRNRTTVLGISQVTEELVCSTGWQKKETFKKHLLCAINHRRQFLKYVI